MNETVKSCFLCVHGCELCCNGDILCAKKGILSCDKPCRKYEEDLTKVSIRKKRSIKVSAN